MTNTVNQMTTKTTAKTPAKTPSLGDIQAFLAALSIEQQAALVKGLGFDSAAATIEQEARNKEIQQLKVEFKALFDTLSNRFLDNEITNISILYNSESGYVFQYGTNKVLEKHTAAKVLVYVAGKAIYNKGPWLSKELLTDIRAIPALKNKEERWLKENRTQVINELVNTYPSRYSFTNTNEGLFNNGPVENEELKA